MLGSVFKFERGAYAKVKESIGDSDERDRAEDEWNKEFGSKFCQMTNWLCFSW